MKPLNTKLRRAILGALQASGSPLTLDDLLLANISTSRDSLRISLNRLEELGTIKSHNRGRGRLASYSLPGASPTASAPAHPPQHAAPTTQPPSITPEQAVQQLARAVTEAAAAVLRQSLRAMVEREVTEALQQAAERAAQTVSEAAQGKAPSASRGSAVRVAIVGLLPGQQRTIEREFGGDLHLSFLDASEHGQRLKYLASHSQAIITMVGFISHSTEDAIKSAGGNLVRVSGGMSSLRTKLTELSSNTNKDTA